MELLRSRGLAVPGRAADGAAAFAGRLAGDVHQQEERECNGAAGEDEEPEHVST